MTKSSVFCAPTAKSGKFRKDSLRLNLSVFKASAEGASDKFRVFTACDVIIFKFHGIRPPPPNLGFLQGNCM